jgi:hypothetical protein
MESEEFEQERNRFKAEAEVAKAKAAEFEAKYKNLLLESKIAAAFVESGGRKPKTDDGGLSPLDAVMAVLKEKIEVDGDAITFKNQWGRTELNSEGRPKTLGEKMAELKKGPMGGLFEPENTNAGSDQSGTNIFKDGRVNEAFGYEATDRNRVTAKTFTVEQARKGRASIDDIASGRAVIQ